MASSFAQGTGCEFKEREGFQNIGFALVVHGDQGYWSEVVNGFLIDQYMGFVEFCLSVLWCSMVMYGSKETQH